MASKLKNMTYHEKLVFYATAPRISIGTIGKIEGGNFIVMEKITNVKLKVVIGLGGGGCLLELIEPTDNLEVKTDVDEYGAHLDDFFAEGEQVPTDVGIYIFNGSAYGYPCIDDLPVQRRI